MPFATTPELLRELATLYRRIAELEAGAGMRAGSGAPADAAREVDHLGDGLHAAVAEFSDDVIGVLTPAADILYLSDGIERLLGYRAGELIGRNAWALVAPEDVASMASARSTPLDDGLPIEVRARHADGSVRWLEFAARAWPRSAPRLIVARWRDAQRHRDPAGAGSDEARRAAELRRSAAVARVSQLALGLPEVQDVLDAAAALAASALALPAGAFLEVADGGLRVRAASGFPVDVRGRGVPSVMTLAGLAHASGAPARAPDVARDGRLADALLAAAGAGCALAVPVRGSGRAHGVLLVAGPAPRAFEREELSFLETVANVVATAVDARAAAEALSGRERLARAVFASARDGMIIVDGEGRCVDANPAAERLLGASLEALRGRRPADVAQTALDLSGAAAGQGVATVATPSGARGVEWALVPGILPGLSLAVLRPS